MFATNEPDESSLVSVFQRRNFGNDIALVVLRLSNIYQKHLLSVQGRLLYHEVSPEEIPADSKKMTAITKLPFPKSKKGMQQFLGSLNYYSRFILDFALYGAALYQLKEDVSPAGSFTVLQRKVAEGPILRKFDAKKDVHIMMYANALSATLMQMHDGKLHPIRFMI
ncbi:hypothetical protein PHMEG_00022015 [Phytophthora megakarya]|uniref:Reverse transcriptase n=1 Tax=Phytophthora megakarya TaxID=4795 RepID=A0A225VL54_9STRA|nr:hypothetical protein PHMEG_00022015 [Phytophthora megakarya]